MRGVIFLLILLLPYGEAASQIPVIPPTGYIPIGHASIPEGLNEGYESRLETVIAQIDRTLPKDVRKDLEFMYRERSTAITDDLNGEDFIFGHPVNTYLENILGTILKAQTTDIGEIRLLVSKDPAPNAACYGEGTIIMNLGLLVRVQNEAEIAMVLCHELAHQILDHSDNGIAEYAALKNDREFEKQVKTALRGSYNRVERIEALALDLAVDRGRHSRSHEHEADSLGFELLKRTPYSRTAALTIMDVLAACDQEPYATALDLEGVFSRAGVPFSTEWHIAGTASSLGYVEKEELAIEDSLKTHPDCPQRKARLEKLLIYEGAEDGSEYLQETSDFKTLQAIARYEIIDAHLSHELYCHAFYMALRGLEVDPEDPYLLAVAGRTMATFYKYQKERKIGFILSRTHKEHSQSYTRLINLVEEMRLSDYSNTAIAFLSSHARPAHEIEHPELLYALTLAELAIQQTVEARQYAERYKELFPEGRHAKSIATLLP